MRDPSGVHRWASSGLLALTGGPDRPACTGPALVAERLVALTDEIAKAHEATDTQTTGTEPGNDEEIQS